MKDERTFKIIGCAIEVHKELGCGFLEGVYQEALGREFDLQGIPNWPQPVIETSYKGEPLEKKYEPDYVCYGEVIVEIKAIAGLSGVEEAQIINYLKATGFKVGLLINFGMPSLEYKRFVFSHGERHPGVRESYAPYGPQITQKDNSGDEASVKSVKSVDGIAWKMWSRMELSTVEGKETLLRFKRPLSLEVTFDVNEKQFVLELPKLNVLLSEKTPKELYKAFCEDILWLWDEYGKCGDRDLSEDGKRLKHGILDLVETEVLP
ncbi:MAG: GxxExxY protein [Deltaproteobacteria bacterium]|nr:GxxExxY protein [Deltaproteobacteria bacterium]